MDNACHDFLNGSPVRQRAGPTWRHRRFMAGKAAVVQENGARWGRAPVKGQGDQTGFFCWKVCMNSTSFSTPAMGKAL